MTDKRHPLIFESDEPSVTIYVVAPDGVLLDVIEDVDPGDRHTARERGRTSLHEACLWAAVATQRYRGRHGPLIATSLRPNHEEEKGCAT